MKTWVELVGESMAPLLRSGDRLLLDWAGGGDISEGDVVVVGPLDRELPRVWAAHRVVRRGDGLGTKGDRAMSWDPPAAILARVIGFRRGGWEVIWGPGGQRLKRLVARISERRTERTRGWGLLLRLVNVVEIMIQACAFHVRRNPL